MVVKELPLSGLKIISLKPFQDSRGFFVERYQKEKMREIGLPDFVQDNFSRSQPKVLRGLHFQFSPGQGKLVSCTRGEIFDVAVDLRQGSPTFGQHASVILNGHEPKWFWIPSGFAHGFCVLGNEEADVMYKVDALYNSQGESSLAWNDPDVKISWPLHDPILSTKDADALSFVEYKKQPRFQWKS